MAFRTYQARQTAVQAVYCSTFYPMVGYMRIIRVCCVLLSVWMLSACTQQQLYNSVKSNQRLKCEKEPPSKYEECMQQTQDSYDEYKREREEILEEDKNRKTPSAAA